MPPPPRHPFCARAEQTFDFCLKPYLTAPPPPGNPFATKALPAKAVASNTLRALALSAYRLQATIELQGVIPTTLSTAALAQTLAAIALVEASSVSAELTSFSVGSTLALEPPFSSKAPYDLTPEEQARCSPPPFPPLRP